MPSQAKNNAVPGYGIHAKGSRGQIDLYGTIGAGMWGDGITLKMFSEDFKRLSNVSQIDVRISSDGGDVFDGRGIYSLLAQHSAKKTVYVDGNAASIASLIAMAGDEIIMGDGTFMMIHNARGAAYGGHDEMRRVAALIESVNASMIDTYAAKTGNTPDQIKTWMDAETWMTAHDAVSKKFATRVSAPVRVAAHALKSNIFEYKNIPAALRPRRAHAIAAIDGMKRLPASP